MYYTVMSESVLIPSFIHIQIELSKVYLGKNVDQEVLYLTIKRGYIFAVCSSGISLTLKHDYAIEIQVQIR